MNEPHTSAPDWETARKMAQEGLKMFQAILDAVTAANHPPVKPRFEKSRAGDVAKCVAQWYGRKAKDLCLDTRRYEVCWPRQVAMYFIRELTNCSLQETAALFNRMDHNTAVHAVRTVANRAQLEPRIGRDIQSLREHLTAKIT